MAGGMLEHDNQSHASGFFRRHGFRRRSALIARNLESIRISGMSGDWQAERRQSGLVLSLEKGTTPWLKPP